MPEDSIYRMPGAAESYRCALLPCSPFVSIIATTGPQAGHGNTTLRPRRRAVFQQIPRLSVQGGAKLHTGDKRTVDAKEGYKRLQTQGRPFIHCV